MPGPFANALGKWTAKAEAEINKTATDNIRRFVFSIFADLVKRTPRDTGRAAASWRIGIGTPDLSSEPPGEYSADHAMVQLDKINGLDLATAMNAVIFITNCAPHILPLEYGHSGQAPSGWVRTTVQEWNGIKMVGMSFRNEGGTCNMLITPDPATIQPGTA